jgi:hypothetical protein
MYEIWSVICIRPGSSFVLMAELVAHFWTVKDLYAALALHLKVLLFLLYNDDIPVPFSPSNYLWTHTTNGEDLKVRGGAQRPVSQICTSNPLNSPFEGSRTFTNFTKPLLPKKRTEQPGECFCGSRGWLYTPVPSTMVQKMKGADSFLFFQM